MKKGTPKTKHIRISKKGKQFYAGKGIIKHKHKWKKKRYDGISVIAEWEVCSLCGADRNRKVKTKKVNDDKWDIYKIHKLPLEDSDLSVIDVISDEFETSPENIEMMYDKGNWRYYRVKSKVLESKPKLSVIATISDYFATNESNIIYVGEDKRKGDL